MPHFKIRALLTDIEGTTSSIAFVKDTLFPYATRAIPGYLRDRATDPSVIPLIQAAADEAGLDSSDLEAVIEQLLEWIRGDRKSTALKAIQGQVWDQGYRDGSYSGHLYPDAYQQLQHWHHQGIPLHIYSSGSIQAQKLFFNYSDYGDLLPWFTHHFDTTTGPKQEPASYRKITAAIGHPPEQILFLSDLPAELAAAQTAGLQVCWLTRPGDHPASPDQRAAAPYPSVASFAELQLQLSAGEPVP